MVTRTHPSVTLYVYRLPSLILPISAGNMLSASYGVSGPVLNTNYLDIELRDSTALTPNFTPDRYQITYTHTPSA
jgi:hypothetical protein